MTSATVLKEAFEAELEFGAFYTGGFIDWTNDGKEVICNDQGKLNVVNVDSTKVVGTICGKNDENPVGDDEESDVIYAFAVDPKENIKLVTAHKSGLLKLWNKEDGVLLGAWKSIHQGPVARVLFDGQSELIATGGCDSSVRIWDFENKVCKANLRGCQGVAGVLAFQNTRGNLIFAAGDDNHILGWDLETKELNLSLEGHFAKITSLACTADGKYLVSTGRDKVVILWDIGLRKSIKTLPVYETIECGVLLSQTQVLPNNVPREEDGIYVAIGGEFGVVKIWEMTKGRLVFTQENSLVSKAEEEGGLAIVQLLNNSVTNQIAVITADHNILIHNLKTFFCSKQLIGFSDEILDITFLGKKDKYIAVATNSPDIKIYDTTTMNCQVLKGHSDTVMSLSSNKNLLLSSSKDKSVRLWLLEAGDTVQIKCVAVGTKHTSSVGSVAMGTSATPTICASVSQDTCLKVWDLPKKISGDNSGPVSLICRTTQIAHEKDINCVTISPNDKLIATASQDKTAKIWNASDLSLVETLRGHKRGVWSVRFSPVDQVLLTTSADCTMKLWSLTGPITCLKSFDCDETSILKGEFITKGMQILSAGSDGLIKVWTIKTNECATTLDKHEGRIWAIAVSGNETNFYSGGSDSKLIKWKDVTESKKTEAIQTRQTAILQEQELMNLLNNRKHLRALELALRLEKPHLTLKIINNIIKDQDTGLKETIDKLSDGLKENLLNHASNWNTNSRNSRPAQLVLEILLEPVLTEDFHPNGLRKAVEDFLPYTERHFKRLTELTKDLQFIEFTLKTMQPHGN